MSHWDEPGLENQWFGKLNGVRVLLPPLVYYKKLLNDLTETNYTITGKKYGVSDNTIRKWIKRYENDLGI